MKYTVITALMLSTGLIQAKSEHDYTNEFCPQSKPYRIVLADKTRPDCMIWGYAIEVDWADKRDQCIGQTLRYSRHTQKNAACLLLIKTPKDCRYVDEAIATTEFNYPSIQIFTYGPAAGFCNAEIIPALK